MGQTLATPLSLTLDHWSEVKARAYSLSVRVKKQKWQTLCTSEWPSFQTGWPPEGSFFLEKVRRVKERVYQRGPSGHPDQIPYITVWENLILSPPLWVRPFVSLSGPLKTEVLALKDGNEEMKASHPVREKKILTTDTDHLLLDPPPPYPPVPQAAAEQGGSASAGEPGVVTAAAGQGGSASAGELGGVTTGTGQGNSEEQGSTTWVEPSAPLLHLEEGSLEGPAAGTRSKKVVSPDSTVLPLRAYGPPDDQGNQLFQYWPFSSADLYNWRTHNPPFSEDPQALIGLIDSLLFSHWPTWDDCQQLLQVLFTTEERQRILLEARKNVPGTDGRPTSLQNEIDAAFPLTRPDWDFNTANGREHLKIYRQTLMAGLRGAARRPTNLAKVRETIQGPAESPSAFLERLMEAFRQFTPYDPMSDEHKATVTIAFIDQSASDIKRKLQKLDGLQDKSLRDLIQVAEKVYYNRETEKEKKKEKAERAGS
ncbi:uncharacterized protein LOC143438363 [Arvicanthis niloticus]|uniref:uncharacterized protein LOC143438363 n=1 Tax=Arvicanthis niloticus TaxID=61156 RepID=UPI00403C86F5